MDCDSFSLRECDKELITLPKMALSGMIMNHENILLDLEDENKPVKKYWSSPDVAIYTKEVFELKDPKSNETAKKKVLCISKPPVEVALTAEMFQKVVLRAVILNRIRRDDCVVSDVGHEFQLDFMNSLIIHNDNKFSIYEYIFGSRNQMKMELKTLIALFTQRKDILTDLHSEDSTLEREYMKDGIYTLKTISCEGSRAFCFWVEGPPKDEITLKKHTFDLMLHVALGAPMWKTGMKNHEKIKEARMMYWKSTPFTTITKIEFSAKLKKYEIFNDVYNISIFLPAAALKALLDHKVQILSDLESKVEAPTDGKDFINEYWTDEIFAIRVGVLYNLYREIDCNVIKFARVENDECVFVVHKEGFLKLLESRNSKRR